MQENRICHKYIMTSLLCILKIKWKTVNSSFFQKEKVSRMKVFIMESLFSILFFQFPTQKITQTDGFMMK